MNDYTLRLVQFLDAKEIRNKDIISNCGLSSGAPSQWRSGATKPSDLICLAKLGGCTPEALKSYLENGIPSLAELDSARTPAHFGERIAEIRKIRGISQGELGKLADVTQPSISAWETGESKTIDGMTLLRVCMALSVNPYWIIFGLNRDESEAQEYTSSGLSTEEKLLVERYRNASGSARKSALSLLDLSDDHFRGLEQALKMLNKII
jgi:transcriptional regulator with XRE-family HTH domain